jgi:hypothetical protein
MQARTSKKNQKDQEPKMLPPLLAIAPPLLVRASAQLNYNPQHERFFWIGGHFTVPYEQKTQQSPASGFNIE